MGIDLPVVWAVIILFSIGMYVVMDGFDLGVGILFPFFKRREDRDVMMNTIAPVWDGNETWLVMGGAGLFAAFPLAYSLVLSAFFLPLTLMLIGLIFRGVAFEFRFRASDARRRWWDLAFICGSLLATFFQGVTLGGFLGGIPVQEERFIGGPLNWVAPFPLFTGLGLVATYALLGSTWLIMRTGGELQRRMRLIAERLAWVLVAFIAAISVWTPLAHEAVRERWFAFPNLLLFSPVPILVALCSWSLLRRLRTETNAWPFALTMLLVFLGYSGLGISLWPNVVPPHLSIRDAAAPVQSMGFTLVGALLVLPMIIGYTAWSYWIFRGKVTEQDGYH